MKALVPSLLITILVGATLPADAAGYSTGFVSLYGHGVDHDTIDYYIQLDAVDASVECNHFTLWLEPSILTHYEARHEVSVYEHLTTLGITYDQNDYRVVYADCSIFDEYGRAKVTFDVPASLWGIMKNYYDNDYSFWAPGYWYNEVLLVPRITASFDVTIAGQTQHYPYWGERESTGLMGKMVAYQRAGNTADHYSGWGNAEGVWYQDLNNDGTHDLYQSPVGWFDVGPYRCHATPQGIVCVNSDDQEVLDFTVREAYERPDQYAVQFLMRHGDGKYGKAEGIITEVEQAPDIFIDRFCRSFSANEWDEETCQRVIREDVPWLIDYTQVYPFCMATELADNGNNGLNNRQGFASIVMWILCDPDHEPIQ